jgi:hypothetical protein
MSCYDKIMEIFKSNGSLSSKDTAKILKEKYNISKSQRAVQRYIRKLVTEGRLSPVLPTKGRNQTYSLVEKHPTVEIEKLGSKAGLLHRLIMIRERCSEIPMLILTLGLMLFYLFALSPTMFDQVASVNMTAWNFTGHEAARVILPAIPHVFVVFMTITIIVFCLDIAKTFSKENKVMH